VRLVLRIVNVLIALVTLASALAVLASDLAIPGYREHYRDAPWFVALYAAVQALIVVEFVRDGRLVPWLALAKTAAAYLFLLNFLALWPHWQVWTPARYVYQLFEASGSKMGLFALVFLGRGAFNTANAMYFTAHWWMPLRVRAPLLGRIVTALLVAAVAFFVWTFVQLVGHEARTFSPEAGEVAQRVLDGVDCEAVRGKAGRTTSDVRQRGERRYEVLITYGCAVTQVVVRAEDGRIGTASGSRAECCSDGSGRPLDGG
jgi:hypothetical protein